MNHHHTNILYKRNGVCMYVFGGQQRKNTQTNCVEILHRDFLIGVFPFRYFTLFQDGVPYSAVTTQSAESVIQCKENCTLYDTKSDDLLHKAH